MDARTLFLGVCCLVSTIVVAGCSSSQHDIEAKRRRLEQLRRELARLQQEVARLEAELTNPQSGTAQDPSVVFELVERGVLQRALEVQGTVESRTTVVLSAKVGGTVVAVHVQPGERVQRGQVLVELDTEVLRRTLAEVEVQRELARALYEKYKRAWEAQAVAEVQYLSAKQQWEALEKRVATLREQIAQSRIVAPFAGIVDNVLVKHGEFLGPGLPAVRLVNGSNLYVAADISEAYVGVVKPGERVELVFPETADTLAGRIRSVGQAIEPRTRTFRIEVLPERIPSGVRPGLHCQVRIPDVSRPQTVIIPLAALQQRSGVPTVFVVEPREAHSGIVRQRSVRLGAMTVEKAEVLAGLQPGERVVVRSSGELRDGMRVRF